MLLDWNLMTLSGLLGNLISKPRNGLTSGLMTYSYQSNWLRSFSLLDPFSLRSFSIVVLRSSYMAIGAFFLSNVSKDNVKTLWRVLMLILTCRLHPWSLKSALYSLAKPSSCGLSFTHNLSEVNIIYHFIDSFSETPDLQSYSLCYSKFILLLIHSVSSRNKMECSTTRI